MTHPLPPHALPTEVETSELEMLQLVETLTARLAFSRERAERLDRELGEMAEDWDELRKVALQAQNAPTDLERLAAASVLVAKLVRPVERCPECRVKGRHLVSCVSGADARAEGSAA